MSGTLQSCKNKNEERYEEPMEIDLSSEEFELAVLLAQKELTILDWTRIKELQTIVEMRCDIETPCPPHSNNI